MTPTTITRRSRAATTLWQLFAWLRNHRCGGLTRRDAVRLALMENNPPANGTIYDAIRRLERHGWLVEIDGMLYAEEC